MRKLIAICSVVLLTMVFARTSDANHRLGIKVGTNISSLDFSSNGPSTLGYEGGVTWQWDLPYGFSIQPDLLYSVQASRLSEISKETLSLGYFKVPVNVQWGLKFVERNVRVFVQASPYIGFVLTKKGEGEAIKTSLGKWADINRVAGGLGLGFGVQLWNFQLTGMYSWNLGKVTSIADVSLSDFNKNNFGGYIVTLAYMFGKRTNK